MRISALTVRDLFAFSSTSSARRRASTFNVVAARWARAAAMRASSAVTRAIAASR